jgi:hypothetical protein
LLVRQAADLTLSALKDDASAETNAFPSYPLLDIPSIAVLCFKHSTVAEFAEAKAVNGRRAAARANLVLSPVRMCRYSEPAPALLRVADFAKAI